MRDYELTVIFNPEIAEEEFPDAIEKVNQFITRKGGSITDANHWGRRKLAYPIKQHGEGHYVLTRFQLSPEQNKELETNLKISEDVIRHLLIKLG